MTERPSVEYMLMAAWAVESPGYAQWRKDSGMKFPNGVWPNIGRRALQWERDGYSQEQIEAEIAAAKHWYDSHWKNVSEQTPKKLTATSPDKKALHDDILGSIKI